MEERLMMVLFMGTAFSAYGLIFVIVATKLAAKRELEKNNAKKFQLNYL